MSINPIQSLPLRENKTIFYYPDLNVLVYDKDDYLQEASKEFGDTLFSFFRGVRILKALKTASSSPKHLFVEPSRECNLACTYCYAHGNPESKQRLPLETVRKLTDKYGFDVISFLGGEPLLNKNYFASIFNMKEWSSFFISTNGLTLDSEFMDLVDEHKELSFQVSIEPKEWGSRITTNGIKQRDLLRTRLKKLSGHRVSFRVTIPENAPHVFLKDFLNELSNDVGSNDFDVSYWPATGKKLPDWIDSWIEESYSLLRNDVDSILSNKLFLSNKYEPYTQERGIKLVGDSLTRSIFSEQGFRYHFCNAGHGSVSVGPDGKLHICHSNAINSSPEDIISSENDPLTIDNTERLKQVYKWVSSGLSSPSCSKCPMKFICGGGCAIDDPPPNAACTYLNKTFPLILSEINAYEPDQIKKIAESSMKTFSKLYEIRDELSDSVNSTSWQLFIKGKMNLDDSLRLTEEYWEKI